VLFQPKSLKPTRDSPVLFSNACSAGRLSSSVEAAEKVRKQDLARDAEKSDLIEWATINDFMFTKGQETPKNHPLKPVRGFFYRLVSLFIHLEKTYEFSIQEG